MSEWHINAPFCPCRKGPFKRVGSSLTGVVKYQCQSCWHVFMVWPGESVPVAAEGQ